ncbi:Atu2307/SP_0267 family LLM class monooxygenase [Pararhizobium mangrovi]|uniref:LLM class flavin-dependent oxidoreductase n=1 Tax=Pararhizobium mangrovi TaxID=2590452 RepID=A0A506UBE6_9HYPH|nr:Atu2307/SP_0267 family LLM class monooxygenase [Pararhizobium mangrovi]TPW30696.1 LLM class flavin-dependent oxidoreductase [Pararhizobium mangrovi]
MEFGLYTFADVGTNPVTGERVDAEKRLNDLIEEIELADQVGLDLFGLGEHHRPDYASSAPAVALAAAAMRTKSIRLTSAVSVLSSDDPIRVFQQFSTLDNLSHGRAEIMAGRGSFIESFPLFGYDLADYDTLYSEKLDLLLKLNEGEHVTWPGGRHTAPIDGRGVYPRPVNGSLPLWIAVGGTPQSVVRAAQFGLPLAIAIIGGEPRRFAPLFELYRRAAREAGHNAAKLKTSLNVHGFVGKTREKAAETFYLPQAEVMNRIAEERGFSPMTRPHFEALSGPSGAIFLGSPAEMVDKILAHHEIFGGFDRFVIQMAIGIIDHRDLMEAIELYGTRVAPEVRKALAGETIPAA